jgi:tetratricopeptide (TPR) repeat protein
LVIVLAAAAVVFAFGLPGGFLLDDFGNLSNLGQAREGSIYGAIYLTEGVGSPGRPLSYLSFLLQSGSWPHDPLAFKLVNIALHLANGALVYAVVARILALLDRADARSIAVVAAAAWLIHPIQVSTVLYVVQRMTELAALFCLGGMLAYLKGRILARSGRLKAGYAWMSAGIALGTPLAVLAKENGALLPLYVTVIEATLLVSVTRPPRWRLWAAVFLALPPLALASYLAISRGWLGGYAIRDFSLAERLYTEAIILWDYVGKISLPRPRAFGIYFDDYPVAGAPWASAATAAALVGWCAALGAALAWRRRLPFFSFAILWFVAGHLLESTVIPLELYFEHRNYLPLLGPVLALAWGAKRLWDAASTPGMRRVYASLGVGIGAALAGVTWVEARTWADPVSQVAVWASERPSSQRAQYALGVQYLYAGRYADASDAWARAQASAPQEAYFDLARLLLACLAQEVPVPDSGQVGMRLANGPLRSVTIELLDNLALQFERGSCRRVSVEGALAVAEGLLANPKAAGGQHEWAALYVKGRLHAVQGELDPAVRALEGADAVLPNLGVLNLQVSWLASAELYDDALDFVEKGRRDSRWRPWQRVLYPSFFDSWERQVREAARRKGVAVRAER